MEPVQAAPPPAGNGPTASERASPDMQQTIQREAGAQASAGLPRRVGRNEPPLFLFQPLRPRFLDGVQSGAGLTSKVLTIVAPIGYGKTVLMSLLFADLRRTGKLCVWLGLDDRDAALDGIVRELQALLLNSHEAEAPPAHTLFRGEESTERRIDALVELIDRHPMPVTIFIDNLNCCSDAALARLLDELTFHTRASVQLVLSSAHEIPLDVSRAQLAGLLRQVGPTDLSFSAGEVAEILGIRLVRALGPQGIEEVTKQTEGWPAAVRLAQIVLSSSEHPDAALQSFTGSDEGIAHLLNRQVLSGFPADVREFLLCIAQLRTFCEELCIHVTGSEQGRDHLTYLLERNVFIIPLDRNRSWYRLHGLFRGHLLREAESALGSKRRQETLIRAARWCEMHAIWRDSVDYALASGSTEIAVRVLERVAPLLVRDRGDLVQYVRWVENLHEHGRQAGPEGEYWFVWALTFQRRYEYARRQCADLAARMDRRQKHRRQAAAAIELRRRVDILCVSIDSLTDRLQDAHAGAVRWLAEATPGQDDPFNLSAAHCIECCYYTNSWQFAAARRSIQVARETAFQAKSAYVDGWVLAYAGLLGLEEGDYATAFPEIAAMLASSRAALGDETGICGTIALIGAKCAVEMGLNDDARQLLEFGMRTTRTHGFLEAVGCGLDAAVLLWDGAGDGASFVGRLRDIAGCYPPRLSLMLSCWLVRRLLRLQRVEEAVREAAHIGLSGPSFRYEAHEPARSRIAVVDALLASTRIDLLIAAHKIKQATSAIAEELRRAKASGSMARAVESGLAAANVAIRSHQHALAVRHVTRAVSVAATRRIVRPFDDHAGVLSSLISETKATAWGFASDEERRFFADLCRKLALNDRALQGRLAAVHEEGRLLGQPTARELELLSFIDAGLSNQQIADRADVSLTTVKWHLQNLYGKLGVSSRSAALARARTLNLLAH
jgi:LuxR family maltose regulon positive regulatory protein